MGVVMFSLPYVREVKEVVSQEVDAIDHVGHFTLIAPDPMAGKRRRYSVIRVDYKTGKARVIGRELPLKDATAIAKAPD